MEDRHCNSVHKLGGKNREDASMERQILEGILVAIGAGAIENLKFFSIDFPLISFYLK